MAAKEIFKPPLAEGALTVNVTSGCSYNRCAFCTMYHGEPFRALPLERTREELAAAKKTYPHVGRVFLEEGDAFALPAARLAEIARLVREFYPAAAISCFASIHNIKTKSRRELAELRALGVNRLNVGAESGLDDVLAFMNKGFTAAETRGQLAKLRAAGIDFSINIINGAAGSGRQSESARANAALVNEVRPAAVFTTNLLREAGSRLDLDVKSGAFRMCTLRQLIEEELEFIERLEIDGAYLYGMNPCGVMPIRGRLMRDKPRMLEKFRRQIASLSAEELNWTPMWGYHED